MPAGPGRLASVSLGADGSFIRARQLVDGYPPWAGTLTQDGFAAVLQGPPSPDGSDFGSARVLSRFGGGGEIAWTRSIDPTNPPGLGGNTDVLLALANGDLLAFLVIDVPSPAMPSTKETDSLARWSADGTPDGEASIGSWLLDAALLELADGRIILKVDNRSAGETESGGLDPGASAFEVLPSLQIRLLTRLSTGPIFNPPVALPGGGFAVVGVLSTGSSTDVAPGQPGHVAYDSTNQTSFVAVFESDGTLRWARRTRKAQTWTDIAGVLPDGGLVVRISGLNGEVEAGDGTFSSYSGTRALAVFGPTGDLRLLQAEPAPGENEGATQFDGGTLTLFAPGELLTSVVLGAGQPHETTLRNTADGASSYTMAVYRYIEH